MGSGETILWLGADHFDRYLDGTGLRARILLAAGRYRPRILNFGQCCELFLRIEHMLISTPMPPVLEKEILGELGRLGEGAVSIRPEFSPRISLRDGAQPRTSAVPGRAAVAETIRLMWSRFWLPGNIADLRAGKLSFFPDSVRIEIATRNSSLAAIPLSGSSPRDRFAELARSAQDAPGKARAAGSGFVGAKARTAGMNPETVGEIRALLDRFLRFRVAFGSIWNRILVPRDPFEFIEMLACPDSLAGVESGFPASGKTCGESARRFAAACDAIGDSGAAEFAALAFRSVILETKLAQWFHRETGTKAGQDPGTSMPDVFSARHLAGSTSRGALVIGPVCRIVPGSRPVSGAVCVCEEYPGLSAEDLSATVALVEGEGSLAGLGSIAACAAGVTYVGGVANLELLPEGVEAAVDGNLGIVTPL